MNKTFRLSSMAVIACFACAAQSAETAGDLKPDPNCVTFQGGANNFGASYKDPKTHEELESVVILEDKDPSVKRKTNERGLLRKYCEVEILDHLGRARAVQILRLSD